MINKMTVCLALLLLSTSTLLAQTTFTPIIQGEIVTDGVISQGSAWSDYDNDGDQDLFVLNADVAGNFLYHNNGNGAFDRRTTAGILDNGGGSGSWGDYDNDGDIDLFVSSENNFLYQNNGNGSFAKIDARPIFSDGGNSISGGWADYDNDGDLDLFVANRGLNFLYRNDGDPAGTGEVSFKLMENSVIFRNSAESEAFGWADYDNDCDVDLFVANDGENNFLYENNGDGTFTQVTTGAIVNDGGRSNSCSWADYDNDFDLDLFVANAGNEQNFLYQNNGDGTFVRIQNGDIVNDPGHSRSGTWGDYDNDGDLDLFVANGNPFEPANNSLYDNNGDGSFTRITTGEIVNDGAYSWSSSAADYDNDGDSDIFVNNRGGVLNPQDNHLYQNDGIGNNWINIKCVGTFSNRSAIGAKVRVTATLSGKVVQQLREISAHTTRGGHNSLNAEFGLGNATVIDSITIEWPSGQRQLLTSVAPNQFLTVTEPVPVAVPNHPPAEIGNEISVVVTDTSGGIAAVTLLYRRGGQGVFTSTPMSAEAGGAFHGTIPGREVSATGIDYRLIVTANEGRSARLPPRFSYSIPVHIPDGISTEKARPHGSAQTAYRIFSVPLDLENASPAALFEDDLGEYDNTRWRFSEYSRGSYREFGEIQFIEAGKAYWFLVGEPARIIDTGAGTTVRTADEFGIAVTSGWNLIGSPFNFPIPVENLRLASGNPVVLRTYTGAWNDPVGSPVLQILPFEGYAIFNDQTGSDVLSVNPDLSGAGLAKTSKRTLSFLRRQESPSHVQPVSEGTAWSLRILAHCQDARDVDNVVGVSSLAVDGWDPLDFPEPPPVGEYVSVYFPRPEWGRQGKRYCSDFRPHKSATHLEGASHLGHAWEFEVKSTIRDRVRLSFAGLPAVPKEFEVWLRDESLNLTQNLRERNEFFLVAGGEKRPKRLKLLVGSGEFVQEDLASVQTVPDDFELSQNFPNPFNPVTTIRFGLPRDETVTLRVFNILGELVATLLDEERRSRDYHAAIWDGRDRLGRQVASGVYVYQLLAGDSRLTRKMALVR